MFELVNSYRTVQACKCRINLRISTLYSAILKKWIKKNVLTILPLTGIRPSNTSEQHTFAKSSRNHTRCVEKDTDNVNLNTNSEHNIQESVSGMNDKELTISKVTGHTNNEISTKDDYVDDEKQTVVDYRDSDTENDNNAENDFLYATVATTEIIELFPFVCGICSQAFDRIKPFYHHFNYHKHEGRSIAKTAWHICIHDSETSKDGNSNFVNEFEKGDNKLFTCGLCGLVFPSVCLLHEHLANEEQIKQYCMDIESNMAQVIGHNGHYYTTRAIGTYKEENTEAFDDFEYLPGDHRDYENTMASYNKEESSNEDSDYEFRETRSKHINNKSDGAECQMLNSVEQTINESTSNKCVSNLYTNDVTCQLNINEKGNREMKHEESEVNVQNNLLHVTVNETNKVDDTPLIEKKVLNEASDYSILDKHIYEKVKDMNQHTKNITRKYTDLKGEGERISDDHDEDSLYIDPKKERRRVSMMQYQRSYRERKKLKALGLPVERKDTANTRFRRWNDRTNRSIPTGEMEAPCDLCGMLFKRKNLRRHRQSHLEVKEHMCDICQKSYKTRNQLYIHKQHHRTTRDHICDHCGKGFNNAPNLRQHIKTHTRGRTLACPYCPKMFCSNYVLKDHVMRHSDAKCHACNVCNKAFKRASEAKRHMLVHSDVKRHPCATCNKTFKSRSNLVRHEKTHAVSTIPVDSILIGCLPEKKLQNSME